MKKLSSVLTAAVLAASFALPLNAAPIFVPKPDIVQAGPVEQVRHMRYRHWRADRYWHRRYAWGACRYYGRCYPRQYGYYGYPDYYHYHRRSGVSIYFNF